MNRRAFFRLGAGAVVAIPAAIVGVGAAQDSVEVSAEEYRRISGLEPCPKDGPGLIEDLRPTTGLVMWSSDDGLGILRPVGP